MDGVQGREQPKDEGLAYRQRPDLIPLVTYYGGDGRALLTLHPYGTLELGDHVTPQDVAEGLMEEWDKLLRARLEQRASELADGRVRAALIAAGATEDLVRTWTNGPRAVEFAFPAKVYGIMDGDVYLAGMTDPKVCLSAPIPEAERPKLLDVLKVTVRIELQKPMQPNPPL